MPPRPRVDEPAGTPQRLPVRAQHTAGAAASAVAALLMWHRRRLLRLSWLWCRLWLVPLLLKWLLVAALAERPERQVEQLEGRIRQSRKPGPLQTVRHANPRCLRTHDAQDKVITGISSSSHTSSTGCKSEYHSMQHWSTQAAATHV
jgi:hypothetical protein